MLSLIESLFFDSELRRLCKISSSGERENFFAPDQLDPSINSINMSTSKGPTSDNVSGLKRLTPWEKKVEQRQKDEAVKTKEREMKMEKEKAAQR